MSAKEPRARLGAAMRQAREASGESLRRFANAIGYSHSHISRVEHGLETPSPDLVKLAEERLGTDGLLRSLYETVKSYEDERRRDARPRAKRPPAAEPSPASEPVALPGDRSEFVADVTLWDGTEVGPGERVTKTWRIRNAGIVSWEGRFLERVGAPNGRYVPSTPKRVKIRDTDPGQEVEISVPLAAPLLPGTSVAHFWMVTAEGRLCFPEGYDDALYVQLTVVAI